MGEPKDFFNSLSKHSEKDPNLIIIDSDQMFSGSSIPFGVKTGLPMLDLAFGRPGWPAGRVIELYGFEASGKTSLALHAISNVQKMGGIGMFIDSERTFDPIRAKTLGVDLNYSDSFHRIEARSLDAGFRAIKNICKSIKDSKLDRPIVVVFDSVQGSQNEYDAEQELGKEQRTGHEAKVIKQGMKSIIGDVAESKVVLILINHAIETVSMMPFAKKSRAAGGHGIKLLSSARVELKAAGKIKKGEFRIGQKIKLLPEKNKVGPLALTEVEAQLLDSVGFDAESSLLDAMQRIGAITESGSGRGKIYRLEAIEKGTEFKSNEWSNLISKLGGIDELYDKFYELCYEKGAMVKYDI